MHRNRAHPALFALTLALLLTGCSANFNTIAPSQTSLSSISGAAHGGRQPIVGAKIYLLEANTKVYAGPGIAADSSGTATDNSSKSLLTSGDGSDTLGYFVYTKSDGSFSISGDYSTCDTGAQVYLYSLGGMPDGVNANSNAGLMAVLGTCGSFGSGTTVNMNELSTIAAAYAFAGFASDATHVGAPSSTDALAATGITNAFANAQQLFDISTNPYSSAHSAPIATKYGTGTVPQQQVNTLANILSACINTSVGGTQCGTLFSGLMSGGTTGSEATDTATEAIYMAHNPAITSIYSVTGTAPNPYTPWDNATAPSDLTIALTFTGGGVTRTNSDPVHSETMAIDASGSVWTVNYSTHTISKFSPLGVPASGSPFSTIDTHPTALAIQSNGTVWVTTVGEGTLSVFNNDGSNDFETAGLDSPPPNNIATCLVDPTNLAFNKAGTIYVASAPFGQWICNVGANDNEADHQTFYVDEVDSPEGLAIDALGHTWTGVGNTNLISTPQIYELVSGTVTTFTDPAIGFIRSVAIDQNNNAWFASAVNMVEISSTGTIGPVITGNGITAPSSVAVDDNNTIWESDYGTHGASAPNGDGAVIALNSSGAILSGPVGYQSASGFAGMGLAIDGSGNIWLDNLAANSIRELIGAAAPVVTPLSAATASGVIAGRP